MNNNKINSGSFSVWLKNLRDSLQKNIPMDVSCGDCRACCTSSLFIHISKDETETISKIDKNLLNDVPGHSEGNYIMGFSSNGFCPMFCNNQCSIYSNRPRTCKAFDCRIFAAAGLKADEHLKENISVQSERWEFSFDTKEDKEEYDALRNAVSFIKEHRDLFPGKKIPALNSELAILAIKVYKVFLSNTIIEASLENKKDIVNEIITELKMFDERLLNWAASSIPTTRRY